jgi:hypothetical protein
VADRCTKKCQNGIFPQFSNGAFKFEYDLRKTVKGLIQEVGAGFIGDGFCEILSGKVNLDTKKAKNKVVLHP